jgi:hypothetical protein
VFPPSAQRKNEKIKREKDIFLPFSLFIFSKKTPRPSRNLCVSAVGFFPLPHILPTRERPQQRILIRVLQVAADG